MRSIHGRLLLAASLVMVAFFGLGAVALERSFRESAERAVQSQLMAHVYALLGAAETDSQGRMRLPESLPDPRFSNPGSGLYAQVVGEQGTYRWHSPSTVGRSLPVVAGLEPGAQRFTRLEADQPLYLLSYSLLWEDDLGKELSYLFVLAENAATVSAQVAAFRTNILLWLGSATVILLLMQGVVLRWGLRPLRTVAADLRMIEQGGREQLEGRYPKELRKLTDAINSLIRHSGASRDRYRHSLGDLAHSLKTPLAVLQGAAEGDEPDQLREAVAEQVPRMNEIVQYQLKSAAMAGQGGLVAATPLRPLVTRLVSTLQKVYRRKAMECHVEIDGAATYPIEQGDLMEALGNVLENAFKYGKSEVSVSLERSDDGTTRLCVADDGEGIPIALQQRILVRGERADQRTGGQGIGLSVANRILHLYGGKLKIEQSKLGGALIVLWMPQR